MKVAETFATLSYCKRLQVGAILVKDDAVISYGFNGTGRGDENVCEDINGDTNGNVIHAEQNVIYKCSRSTSSSFGSTMIVTHSPCKQCALAILQSGIEAVYYKHDYRDRDGVDYLIGKGIPCIKLPE